MTAYAVPDKYSHGDQPTHTSLNKISTGQTHINELAPSIITTPAVPYLSTGEYMRMVHRHRYLHYKSSGYIEDPAGIEDDVSLSNTSDDWVNVYDLDQVAWLSYGAVYYVRGVDFAQEHGEPE